MVGAGAHAAVALSCREHQVVSRFPIDRHRPAVARLAPLRLVRVPTLPAAHAAGTVQLVSAWGTSARRSSDAPSVAAADPPPPARAAAGVRRPRTPLLTRRCLDRRRPLLA